MSRRSRSTRSGRRGGRAGLPTRVRRVVPVQRFAEDVSIESVLRTFAPIPGLCSSCGAPSRDVGLEEFLTLWASVSLDGIEAALVDDVDPDSAWWCDDCARGGAVLVMGRERVPLGVGGSCSCCA